MHPRVQEAVRWLAAEFGMADKRDFLKHFYPGGAMLLDATLSEGLTRLRHGDEVILTPEGFATDRKLARQEAAHGAAH